MQLTRKILVAAYKLPSNTKARGFPRKAVVCSEQYKRLDGVELYVETLATRLGVLFNNGSCKSSLGIPMFISASGSSSGGGAVLAVATVSIRQHTGVLA